MIIKFQAPKPWRLLLNLIIALNFSYSPEKILAQVQIAPPIRPEPLQPQEPIPPDKPPLQLPETPTPFPEVFPRGPETIVIKQFEFVGNTAFKDEELAKILENLIGKEITFNELLQAANRITEYYFQAGYITSGAYIPSQELANNIVKIQILEGSLEGIEVEIVTGRLNPNYVRDRLQFRLGTPLNIQDLQTALQLLQLNPLIARLEAELSAGTRPGTNNLAVKVFGAKTFSLQPFIDNNRNPAVGTFERGIGLSEGNLFGLGDRLQFTYSNTDGSNRYEGSYTLPFNPLDGTIRFYYRSTDNRIIEPPLDQLDLEIVSRDFEVTMRQPLVQTASATGSQEFALSLGFLRRETDGTLDGEPFPLSLGANNQGEVRLSALQFSQEWLARGREDVIAVNSQLNFGIDAFDATINSGNLPDSEYFLWRGQFFYLRLLAGEGGDPSVTGPTILLRSNWQIANQAILPIEQISIGGYSSVRGYRQDQILTDSGFIASAEVRVPIMRVPAWQASLQVTPFLDFGTGWNTEFEDPDPNTLVGTGLGLLWQMGNSFSARLDWGIPLVYVEETDNNSWQEHGIYFIVEYNLEL